MSPYSIICLQETGLAHEHEIAQVKFQLQKMSQYSSYWSPAKITDRNGRSGGVGIILHPYLADFFDEVRSTTTEDNANYLRVECTIEMYTLYLHGVYAPINDRDRLQYYQSRERNFRQLSSHIVMGDFNDILDPSVDAKGPATALTQSAIELQQWFTDIDVVDMWRFKYPKQVRYTNPMKRTGRSRRIDMIAGSYDLTLQTLVAAGHREDIIMGDHVAVEVCLQGDQITTKSSPWRMKSATLQHPSVQKKLYKQVDKFIKTQSESPLMSPHKFIRKYDKFIRQQVHYVRSMQRMLNSRQKASRTKVEKAFTKASQALQESPSPANWIKYKSCKDNLQTLNTHSKEQGYLTRMELFVQTQEKSTKQFFRPPIRSLPTPAKVGVYLEDGQLSKDTADMLTQYEKTWGRIFADPKYTDDLPTHLTDEVQVPFPDNMPKLSEEAKNLIDQPFSTAELEEVIISLPKNRSPGKDGIINEFYQVHPRGFASILIKVFQCSVERGQLRKSQRQGLVSLLYKKGDKHLPENYRPITLLGTEIKIYTRALNARIIPFLSQIIHSDQKGFIPKRNIHDCIDTFHYVQQYVIAAKQQGYAMLIDFQKAYDRVNISYLLHTLRHLNFGPRFVSWIQMLYTGGELFLNINGFLSTAIRPSSGVKQGDPISPTLFAIVLEPLLQQLRLHQQQWGIRIGPSSYKIVEAFADDVTTYASTSAQLRQQLQIIQRYGEWANARVNVNKTHVLSLNPAFPVDDDDTPWTIQAPLQSVRLLGIQVGTLPTNQTNISNIEVRMLKRLNQWHTRGLTIQGRILITQAMILSVGHYFMHHIDLSRSFLNKWQSIIDSYITGSYRGTPGRRKLNAIWIQQPTKSGGLGGPNLKLIYQTIQLKKSTFWRLQKQPEDPPWHTKVRWSLTKAAQNHLREQDLMFMPPEDIPYRELNPVLRIQVRLWNTLQVEPVFHCASDIHRTLLWQCPIWQNRFDMWTIGERSQQLSVQDYIGDTRLVKWCRTRGIHSLADMVIYAKWNVWPDQTTWTQFWTVQEDSPGSLHLSWQLLYTGLTIVVHQLNRYTASPIDSLPTLQVTKELQWQLQLPSGPKAIAMVSNQELQHCLRPGLRPPTHPIYKWNFGQDYVDQKIHLQLFHKTKKLLQGIAPTLFDLQLRLQMRMLILGERWRYQDITRAYCSLCDLEIVETSSHLFWECRTTKLVRRPILNMWNSLTTDVIEWKHCVLPHLLPSLRHPEQFPQAQPQDMCQLWGIMNISFTKQLWHTRNKIRFEQQSRPAITTIRKAAMRTLWQSLLLWCATDPTESRLQVLESLVQHSPFLQEWWHAGYNLRDILQQRPRKPRDHLPISSSNEARLRFDGGSLSNPGHAGSGWHLDIINIEGTYTEYSWGAYYIGNNCTNNEAEYVALIQGLHAAHFLGFRSLLVEGDSNLVIHQIQSRWKSREPYSEYYKQHGLDLLQHFSGTVFNHVWRRYNDRADTLSKLAMQTRQQHQGPHLHNWQPPLPHSTTM